MCCDSVLFHYVKKSYDLLVAWEPIDNINIYVKYHNNRLGIFKFSLLDSSWL